MKPFIKTPLALVLASMLGACASSPGGYPSLTCRPTAPMTPSNNAYVQSLRPQPAVDQSAILTVGQLTERADRIAALDRQFEAELVRLRSRIVNGSRAAPESSAFAEAQLALSDLSGIHAETVSILAALEESFAQSSLTFDATDAMAAALSQADAIATRQREELDRLSSS